jgi:hypothetical protein
MRTLRGGWIDARMRVELVVCSAVADCICDDPGHLIIALPFKKKGALTVGSVNKQKLVEY